MSEYLKIHSVREMYFVQETTQIASLLTNCFIRNVKPS